MSYRYRALQRKVSIVTVVSERLGYCEKQKYWIFQVDDALSRLLQEQAGRRKSEGSCFFIVSKMAIFEKYRVSKLVLFLCRAGGAAADVGELGDGGCYGNFSLH